MARLILNPDYSLKDLGCEVLRAARGRAQDDKGEEEVAERKIHEILANVGNPEIKFVYDSPKLAHIVIPNLSGKVTEKEEDHESWCCKLAYEAMGGIVVYGCSS